VVILDSATLQQLKSLELPLPPWKTPPDLTALAFSPDGRMLTSFFNTYSSAGILVVNWDLQTGGVVTTIEREQDRDSKMQDARITHSGNGTIVAVLSQYEYSVIISMSYFPSE